MGLHSEHQGLWRLYSSVAVGTTVGAAASADLIDIRGMSRMTIYASSTYGTPTLTAWVRATSTGPSRLVKTSTGGAVAKVMIANAANVISSLSGGGWLALTSSTTAAAKTIPWVQVSR